ncbi:hypothetical protein C6500_19170 [Candidatus Poribacteria bacterium]|nr:MAG: hypothetical protein C6500_19170 [Candidatus Poribacteria bacterium]
MFREFLKTREFLIGIIFFVMVVFGTGIYAWHVISSTNVQHSETQRLESPLKTTTTADTLTLNPVDFDTSQPHHDESQGSPLREHTQSTTDRQASVGTHKTAPIDASDAVTVARDTTNDGSVTPPSADKADEEEEITPEEQEERERRKRAGEIIERFMQMPAEIEIPISDLDPALVAELKEMGVSQGTAKYYRYIPPEVREAQRILQSDEPP